VNHLNKRLYVILGMQGISLIGSRLTAIAIGIAIVKETGNVTPLLLISLFNELPLLFAGTWIGLAADRWKRKTAMLVGDTGQAACTVLLVLCLLLTDFSTLWPIYAIVAIQGLFQALQASATTALMPIMANEAQLDRANSLKELLFPLAGIIAPFCAGMLYEPIGLVGIVAIDLITYIICSVVIAFIPLPEIKGESRENEEETLWSQASQGYRFLWHNKPLLYLFLYFAWWNFILNGPLELAIPYFLQRTNSDALMSLLLAIMNAGALTGAVAAVWWGHFRSKITFIFAGSMLTSTMFILVGTSRHVWLMGAALFLLMLPLAMTGALFHSIIQRKTPLSMQGRVFAAYGQLSAAMAPLSFLITGPVVDKWLEPSMQEGRWLYLQALVGQGAGSGIGLLFAACGVLLAIGGLWTLSSSKVRNMETELRDQRE